MRFVRRILLALMPLTMLFTVALAAPSAQAEAPLAEAAAVGAAFDSETGRALAAWDTGNICFWNGFGGTGGRCMWDVADSDWTSGTHKCSWATTKEVKSVYNRGTSSAKGVRFYRNTGYNNSIGCTKQGQKGDLAGTYQVRSRQWVSTTCG